MVKIIHVESFDFYGTGSQQQQQDDKQVLKQHVKKLLNRITRAEVVGAVEAVGAEVGISRTTSKFEH